MTDQNRVGMIGVGLMGHGIARNVLAGGHTLCFLSHPGNQPTDDLEGAVAVQSLAAVCANADVIIICVTGSAQVREVVLGEGGLIEHIGAGKTLIDCSTSLPTQTRDIAAAVLETGAHFLDAPMTRTPREAALGRLNLLVGGDAATLAAHKKLLACFAENITHVGPSPGDGHTAKLLHNFVSLGFAAVLAEAFAAASQSGLDSAALAAVLEAGGGKGVALDRMAPFATGGDMSALMFSIANAAKDTGYYAQHAAAISAASSLADAVSALYGGAVDNGNGDRLVPELIALLSRSAKSGTPPTFG